MYGDEWRSILDTPIEENAEENATQEESSILNYLQTFQCENGDNDQLDAHYFLF